ncbi:MAG TPA: hypothetical protein VG965_03150 [Patescibacteria group bacterium]|nr:hypothetical protein [Patescibacteria group bacterium]
MANETLRSPEHLLSNRKPVFEGGAFDISVLSESPTGLQVVTDKTLKVSEFFPVNAEGKKVSPLNPDQRKQLGESIKLDVDRALRNAVGPITPEHDEVEERKRETVLRDMLSRGNFSEERIEEAVANMRTHEEKIKFDTARRKAIESMTAAEHTRYLLNYSNTLKVGLRNKEENSGTITTDLISVPYFVYRLFNKPELSPEIHAFSANSAASLIVRTRGENGQRGKFIVQHRRHNQLYDDIPGASAAGIYDAKIKRHGNGTIEPITENGVVGHALKETGEEIGLKKNTKIEPINTETLIEFAEEKLQAETGEERQAIKNIRITGLAHDKVAVHDEFLLFADTDLTYQELLANARRAPRQEKLDDFDFREKFFAIDATAEAIEKLIAESECPLPPTHSAAFVAAGYLLVLEEKGHEAAEAWKTDIQKKFTDNWNKINRKAADFHQSHPEIKEKYPNINTEGYDPSLIPELQGLPNLEDELDRLGIKEVEQVDEAFIVDADGVLTDIHTKELEPGIVDEIIGILENSTMCINTGRSRIWFEQIENAIKNRIMEQKKDMEMMRNLFVACEMGGVTIEYDRHGNATENIDPELTIPEDLKNDLRTLASRYDYGVFYDEEKKTMATLERQRDYSQDDFKNELQNKVFGEISALVGLHEASENLKFAKTTIAIDVQDKKADKGLGARKYNEWLAKRKIKPAKFIAMGDSENDEDMASELANEGENVDFVYVGTGDLSKDGNPQHNRVQAAPFYSALAARFLREHRLSRS